MSQIHHYILTRFNLVLWKHDKAGKEIGGTGWLERRMELFERFCLPSVAAQTVGEFVWILLLDENTPERFLRRLNGYREVCGQIKLIRVKGSYGRYFAKVFQGVVREHLLKSGASEDDICITTYLDNDDCIECGFVEDVQKRCRTFPFNGDRNGGGGMFLSYDYGLQLYCDMGNVTTRIWYPNNHFLSYAERVGNLNNHGVRTCYGFGSHFLLEKRGLAVVSHVKDSGRPMWIEVIHKENVDNDVKMTFRTSIVSEPDLLRRHFAIDETVGNGYRLELLARTVRQMLRRLRNKMH